MECGEVNMKNHNGPGGIETLGLVLISGSDLQIPPQGMLQDIDQMWQVVPKDYEQILLT